MSVENLNEEEIKTLRKAVMEINDSLLRMDAEKELQKEILDKVSEELNIEKKIITKVAKVYFKNAFDKEKAEHESFEDVYDRVINKQ